MKQITVYICQISCKNSWLPLFSFRWKGNQFVYKNWKTHKWNKFYKLIKETLTEEKRKRNSSEKAKLPIRAPLNLKKILPYQVNWTDEGSINKEDFCYSFIEFVRCQTQKSLVRFWNRNDLIGKYIYIYKNGNSDIIFIDNLLVGGEITSSH